LITAKNQGSRDKFVICISVSDCYFLTINSNSYDYEKNDECKILKSDYKFLKYDSYIRIARPLKIFDNDGYKLNSKPKYIGRLKEETINDIKKKAISSKTLPKMFKEFFKDKNSLDE
jgi:hypothetical protein